jgi:hypothetical protein
MKRASLEERLDRGWSKEKALMTKPRFYNNSRRKP